MILFVLQKLRLHPTSLELPDLRALLDQDDASTVIACNLVVAIGLMNAHSRELFGDKIKALSEGDKLIVISAVSKVRLLTMPLEKFRI